jgi:hypothetical protein
VPLCCAKALTYGGGRRHWLAALLLLPTSLALSLAHVLCAYNVAEWTRRRYQMGLLGFGYPWEVGGRQAQDRQTDSDEGRRTARPASLRRGAEPRRGAVF